MGACLDRFYVSLGGVSGISANAAPERPVRVPPFRMFG